MLNDPDALRSALQQSLNLQSHYAEMLNAYDGGGRRSFASVEDWLGRLHETGWRPEQGTPIVKPAIPV